MTQAVRPIPSDPAAEEAARGPCGLRHVGIIMDGNGRWAVKRGLPRVFGHRAGVDALRGVVRHFCDLGIPYLTIYSFSSENWSRPAGEVSELLGLLKRFIRHDLADLHARNVRVRVIGERASLSDDLVSLLEEAEAKTARNTGLTFVVAFNYGARQEIVAAARAMAEAVYTGRMTPDEITEEALARHLTTSGIPDPDLIIRTSGEQRLSNFLMWQAAYAEFVFTPVLWPDFDRAALDAALLEYGGRKRRFGGL
ncbi:MAG: isoprenyl transferase [Proteobacteria bacterium]|nr:isoprenyl transferase [Pseudomonadota bacterium]